MFELKKPDWSKYQRCPRRQRQFIFYYRRGAAAADVQPRWTSLPYAEIVAFFMPNILKNDDVMTFYKLTILDVVNTLGFHFTIIYFLFWYYHSEKSFNCTVSIEISVRSVFPAPDPGSAKERFKSRFHPDLGPNLVLNLSWPCLTSTLALVLILF
jgi:hypothetical protein